MPRHNRKPSRPTKNELRRRHKFINTPTAPKFDPDAAAFSLVRRGIRSRAILEGRGDERP